MIQVVNFHAYKSAAALTKAFGNHWLYVGRANTYYKLAGSPLGNPFTGYRPGPQRSAIKSYRVWLWRRMVAGDKRVMAELGKITEDTILVCWCAPDQCHADIIKAAAEWLLRGKEKPPGMLAGGRRLGEDEAPVMTGVIVTTSPAL